MTRSTNKKKFSWFLLVPVISLFLGGCTARTADLTLVSTKNIDISDTRLDAKTGTRHTGEDCRFVLLDLIPFGWPNLKESIDEALEKGKGNVMVDEVTEVKSTWFLLGTLVCIDVEGTVLTAPTGKSSK